MSAEKPIVVVTGATGKQGGSVVTSLLAAGKYRVRGLTRNVDSDKAKALKARGVEVVKCDLFNKEDVKNALTGAEIAYIVTDYWNSSIVSNEPHNEERQGKLIADVAKETGLKWLLFSSSPDTTAESNGKYSEITHFYGKNHVEQYIKKLGIPHSTFFYVGYYFQNIGWTVRTVDKGDVVEVIYPFMEENDTLAMVDVENDVGPIVAKIIDDGPAKWDGKKVPVAAEYVTIKHIIDTLTKATGKTHKLRTVNDEIIAKEFPDTKKEFRQMFEFLKEYGVFGIDNEVKDISIAKKLHPSISTYEQFVAKTYAKK